MLCGFSNRFKYILIAKNKQANKPSDSTNKSTVVYLIYHFVFLTAKMAFSF